MSRFFTTAADIVLLVYYLSLPLQLLVFELFEHQCTVQKGVIQGFQCVKPAPTAKPLNIKFMV